MSKTAFAAAIKKKKNEETTESDNTDDDDNCDNETTLQIQKRKLELQIRELEALSGIACVLDFKTATVETLKWNLTHMKKKAKKMFAKEQTPEDAYGQPNSAFLAMTKTQRHRADLETPTALIRDPLWQLFAKLGNTMLNQHLPMEASELGDRSKCIHCRQQRRWVVYLPCRHLLVCNECAERDLECDHPKCPECNSHIKNVLPLLIPPCKPVPKQKEEAEEKQKYRPELRNWLVGKNLQQVTDRHIEFCPLKELADTVPAPAPWSFDAVSNIDVINDYLYISSWPAAQDAVALEQCKITKVLRLFSDHDKPKYELISPGIEYKNVIVEDAEDVSLDSFCLTAALVLKEWIAQDQKILVHCVAGISRSATLVIYYLMVHQKYTLPNALRFIRSARGCVNPNDGFLAQLIELHKELAFKRSPPPTSTI
jgi:protein-tyrosine phosphatase